MSRLSVCLQYKKQLNKLKKSRDGRAKKYANKSSRDNNKQDASLHVYIQFSSNGFYENV